MAATLIVPVAVFVNVDVFRGKLYVVGVLTSNAPSLVKLVKLIVCELKLDARTSTVPWLVMAEVELRLPSKPRLRVPRIVMADGIVTLAKPDPPSPMLTVYAAGMFPLRFPVMLAI